MSNIMIQGTASSAGKSIFCTGLCALFKKRGFNPAPFKSQNMSSKFFVTEDGKKISTAQALQAEAAGLPPSADMNPILLIPKSDTGAKVILMGEEKAEMDAREYFNFKKSCKPLILSAYKRLEEKHNIIVLEGAGSPAEINLNQNDIVNMGMAKMADAPVLLISDINMGGVFAHLYGTVMLLPEEDRKRIKGLVINKFRGDRTLLSSGIKMIEELLNIPVIGVIPYFTIRLEDEDSLVSGYAEKISCSQTRTERKAEFEKIAGVIESYTDMKTVYKIMNLE